MQRCPYIHEMKERLLSSQGSNPEQQLLEGMDKDVLEIHGDPTVGTVVKVLQLFLHERTRDLFVGRRVTLLTNFVLACSSTRMVMAPTPHRRTTAPDSTSPMTTTRSPSCPRTQSEYVACD